MRLRAGSSLLYPMVVAVTIGTGLLVGAGCGGGSSDPQPKPSASGTATPTPVPTATAVPTTPLTVRTVILWGARSRQTAVTGQASALSAVLSLRRVGDGTEVLSQVLNRDVPSGNQLYTSPTTVPAGAYNLLVQFYTQRDGQGQVVGVAAAGTSVIADLSTTDPNDGQLSTTIAAVGTIKSVNVPAGQTIAIGQTKSLDLTTAATNSTISFEPRDAAGNLIAVTPGSAFISLVEASSNSTVTGQLAASVSGDTITGLAPQRATVVVSVDGTPSAQTEIAITSGIVAGSTFTVSPTSTTVSILQTQNFTANIPVANDGPAGTRGVTWSILDNADGSKGTITASGVFTATRQEGNYTVRATSVFDPRVFIDIPVQVLSQVAVTLQATPDGPLPVTGGQIQFRATVSNVPEDQDQGVTYRVVEANGGRITQDGLYTGPRVAGTYTVVATSNFDDRKSATYKVTVRVVAGNVVIGVG